VSSPSERAASRRPPRRAAQDVDEIWTLFAAVGDGTYDEDVTQEHHARQCAALAAAAGAPSVLVAAALLHDVGHLLAMAGAAADRVHERAGADWLAGLLPEAVLAPIRLHVAAKRYLCAVDPAYRRSLSPGSERSLVVQGGPFTPPTIERFEAAAGHEAAVALRLWDDRAKDPAARVPAVDDYRPTVAALLIATDARRGGGRDRRG
jgi:phosphonate degradation associated HDIG domain protein